MWSQGLAPNGLRQDAAEVRTPRRPMLVQYAPTFKLPPVTYQNQLGSSEPDKPGSGLLLHDLPAGSTEMPCSPTCFRGRAPGVSRNRLKVARNQGLPWHIRFCVRTAMRMPGRTSPRSAACANRPGLRERRFAHLRSRLPPIAPQVRDQDEDRASQQRSSRRRNHGRAKVKSADPLER